MTAGAIGIFDSGVGGLSVLREIRARLPAEDVLFIADSGHVPYGSKSQGYVQQRSLALARFSFSQGVKALVVACNTATAAAAPLLRATFEVPIVAMEPAVKPAAHATKSGVVGVLATVGTLQSARFAGLLQSFGRTIEVVTQPAPGLVEAVETGDLDSKTTRALVSRYIAPLLAAGADTIVLGCTHYPFLHPLISEVAGADVALIDTGAAVADRLVQVIDARGLANGDCSPGTEGFWTSGDVNATRRVLSILWADSVRVSAVPPPFA